ncbi:cation transporter [Lentilactobacillus sp. Marseille-Q4993]|uniref:cation transporter n=1 Tax=Lentilactobacillus sp. Marseille-Q4993 TaxID=3039492 RepID=UPI0024BCB834|nr:cation transporter [Lentilactobacillus sp. Marseille-Q4993]
MESSNSVAIKHGLLVEYFSTVWMAFEFVVGFASGVQAGSVLLIAFGLDSVLETISGGTLIWRLKKEQNGADSSTVAMAEKRSSMVVGVILILLAVYVIGVSVFNLLNRIKPDTSASGIAIAVASVFLMPILAIIKRHIGQAAGSAALVEDGLCNITCAYMAATVLIGALLNAFFGWWWADSIAALALVYFIASEGWESIQEALE